MVAALCLLLAVAPLARSEPLVVSAAISLSEALEEAAAAFRASGGTPVSFNFAGSNVLSRQILNGAPVDVFISADAAQMDLVERAGLLKPGSRTAIASNRLAIVAGPRAQMVRSAGDLASPEVRRIAVGDPTAVPAGVYAKAYLEGAGLWNTLRPKLVPTTSVRAALAAVENGSAQAAIVYVTDVRRAPGVRVAAIVEGPGSGHIVYPAAVVRTSRRAETAAGFLDLLRSETGQRILERHGFARPPSRP